MGTYVPCGEYLVPGMYLGICVPCSEFNVVRAYLPCGEFNVVRMYIYNM